MISVKPKQMSPLTHQLIGLEDECEKYFQRDKSFMDKFAGALVVRVCSFAVSFFLHAEAVCRAATVCFLSIASYFSRVNYAQIAKEKEQSQEAYRASMNAMVKTFRLNAPQKVIIDLVTVPTVPSDLNNFEAVGIPLASGSSSRDSNADPNEQFNVSSNIEVDDASIRSGSTTPELQDIVHLMPPTLNRNGSQRMWDGVLVDVTSALTVGFEGHVSDGDLADDDGHSISSHCSGISESSCNRNALSVNPRFPDNMADVGMSIMNDDVSQESSDEDSDLGSIHQSMEMIPPQNRGDSVLTCDELAIDRALTDNEWESLTGSEIGDESSSQYAPFMAQAALDAVANGQLVLDDTTSEAYRLVAKSLVQSDRLPDRDDSKDCGSIQEDRNSPLLHPAPQALNMSAVSLLSRDDDTSSISSLSGSEITDSELSGVDYAAFFTPLNMVTAPSSAPGNLVLESEISDAESEASDGAHRESKTPDFEPLQSQRGRGLYVAPQPNVSQPGNGILLESPDLSDEGSFTSRLSSLSLDGSEYGDLDEEYGDVNLLGGRIQGGVSNPYLTDQMRELVDRSLSDSVVQRALDDAQSDDGFSSDGVLVENSDAESEGR